MIKLHPTSYVEARHEFREATKDLKQESYEVTSGLTIDSAEHHNKNKDTLIIIQSGTHGVEGYVGSFFQLFFMKNYFEKIKKKYGVLLIHALNPYGYYNNRRVNENNVDLNRNFLENYDHDNYTSKKVAKCMEKNHLTVAPARPRRFPLYEIIIFWYKLLVAIFKFGLNTTIKAGSFGQTKWPKCVCYAGDKAQKSNLIFTEIIKKTTRNYKRAIFIDIHTGTARKMHFRGFTRTEGNTRGFKILRETVRDLQRDGRQGMGVDFIGGISTYFHKISKAKENMDLVLEYGTISNYSTLFSIQYLSHLLVKENQVTWWGPKDRLLKYRDLMKKAYSPDSDGYRNFLKKSSRKILDNLLKNLDIQS